MLDLTRYLLGAAELLVLCGSALLAASALRARLLPALEESPAHLATAVLGLALLIWASELLGSFGLFEPLPLLLVIGSLAVAAITIFPRVVSQGVPPRGSFSYRRGGGSPATTGPAGRSASIPLLVGLAIAALAVLHFAGDVRPKLSTGMTGFDSTWYHGPFAAGFFQSGDTWALHQIAPQFLAWFYPANAELFHAIGMAAFGRDIVSPLLNLAWLVGCLAACWCIGRPYRVGPWSLALGAVALSVPALSDQAGEARNDLAGIFFLLAAVALALNVRPDTLGGEGGRPGPRGAPPTGAIVVVGLSAGLAAGTKLNFLLPAAVLLIGVAAAAAPARGRALGIGTLAALAGGGYWYLRNLVHAGSPLPWFDSLGPIALPAPDQPLGGREGHSVIGYLGDGSVWLEWLLPGLHQGLTVAWPLLLAAMTAGLLLSLGRRSEPMLRVAALVGLAAALAWLIAPTSASGPDGMPRGFESGLRYLAPALALGLALLPATPALRARLSALSPAPSLFVSLSGRNGERARRVGVGGAVLALLAAIGIGYPVQRHYLEHRYASPDFSAPGLDAAFAWSRSISGSRIATTSTRQYPLFGTDLSNHVQFVGEERPHGGFVPPTSCRAWRRLIDAGAYDYVVASRDRLEPGKPPYPPSASWTEGPGSEVVLRKPPTVVFKLTGPLNPSACGQ
jgi:hypothetical protein